MRACVHAWGKGGGCQESVCTRRAGGFCCSMPLKLQKKLRRPQKPKNRASLYAAALTALARENAATTGAWRPFAFYIDLTGGSRMNPELREALQAPCLADAVHPDDRSALPIPDMYALLAAMERAGGAMREAIPETYRHMAKGVCEGASPRGLGLCGACEGVLSVFLRGGQRRFAAFSCCCLLAGWPAVAARRSYIQPQSDPRQTPHHNTHRTAPHHSLRHAHAINQSNINLPPHTHTHTNNNRPRRAVLAAGAAAVGRARPQGGLPGLVLPDGQQRRPEAARAPDDALGALRPVRRRLLLLLLTMMMMMRETRRGVSPSR